MTLMKLLRTTNMLSEAKDQPHRYKVRAGALPTFGNPTEPAVNNFGGATIDRVKAARPVKRSARSERSGWAQKLNPFATQGAPVERSAVQGELSLDRVKPVRSDLSDTDLELVAAVKKPEATPGVVRIESVDVPVVKVAPFWERMRGIFLRAP
jgi:hypothetical protein